MNLLPSQLNAFTVFLGIGAIGFLFLIISVLFGELFDHLGGIGDHFDHGGPGFFSGRVMAVFITAFGGFGAVATNAGLSVFLSTAIGFSGGVIFGGAIGAFAKFLFGQQASSDVRSTDLVGQTARVVVTIPAGGIGQIRCRVGEELVDKVARSSNGESLAENTPVLVEEVLGETVIVKKR
jgi:membrane protein implicated in regulation of membrane protease activity